MGRDQHPQPFDKIKGNIKDLIQLLSSKRVVKNVVKYILVLNVGRSRVDVFDVQKLDTSLEIVPSQDQFRNKRKVFRRAGFMF